MFVFQTNQYAPEKFRIQQNFNMNYFFNDKNEKILQLPGKNYQKKLK